MLQLPSNFNVIAVAKAGFNYFIENKHRFLWSHILLLVYGHIFSVYALYLVFTFEVKLSRCLTIIFVIFYGSLGILGMSIGGHRLWSHNSYKANYKLRILLMLMFTTVYEEPIYLWARNHRAHHKYSETNADPHNPSKGMFYAHFGWYCLEKHEEVKNKKKQIDMSDLESDPVVQINRKYYLFFITAFGFIIPGIIPWYFWSENISVCYYFVNIFRITFVLNNIFTLNSISHRYGYKPYDKNIGAVNNPILDVISLGDGSHNYHHTFPWDYRSTEFKHFTLGTHLIEYFHKIGWAYDLKMPNKKLIISRSARTGDGSRDLQYD